MPARGVGQGKCLHNQKESLARAEASWFVPLAAVSNCRERWREPFDHSHLAQALRAMLTLANGYRVAGTCFEQRIASGECSSAGESSSPR